MGEDLRRGRTGSGRRAASQGEVRAPRCRGGGRGGREKRRPLIRSRGPGRQRHHDSPISPRQLQVHGEGMGQGASLAVAEDGSQRLSPAFVHPPALLIVGEKRVPTCCVSPRTAARCTFTIWVSLRPPADPHILDDLPFDDHSIHVCVMQRACPPPARISGCGCSQWSPIDSLFDWGTTVK